MTKHQWARAIENLHTQEQRELQIVTAAVTEKYHGLRQFAINMYHEAPEEGTDENSKGTPPDENSNTAHPPTKIEITTPPNEN